MTELVAFEETLFDWLTDPDNAVFPTLGPLFGSGEITFNPGAAEWQRLDKALAAEVTLEHERTFGGGVLATRIGITFNLYVKRDYSLCRSLAEELRDGVLQNYDEIKDFGDKFSNVTLVAYSLGQQSSGPAAAFYHSEQTFQLTL